jgi:hypothetical protein
MPATENLLSLSSFLPAMRKVVGVLVALALIVFLPGAQAGSLATVSPPDSRTVTVAVNDYAAFSVNIATSWSLVVGITVTTGGNIDVYVTQQGGYNDYINPNAAQFLYLVSGTQENTRSYNKTLSSSGLYYIIVDNDDVTLSGAQPSGSVTVQMFFGQSQTSFLLGLVIILIIVLVIVAFVVLRRRRKAAQVPPLVPPPMQPPPLEPPQTPPQF